MNMPLKKPLVLLLLAFLSTSLIATSYALATTPFLTNAISSIHPRVDRTQDLSSHQGISGGVTIANVSPVCSLTGSVPATGPELVIRSPTGNVQVVALSWTLQDRCELLAPFQATTSPRTYQTAATWVAESCRLLPL